MTAADRANRPMARLFPLRIVAGAWGRTSRRRPAPVHDSVGVRPAPVTYRIHLVHLDGREEPCELTSLSGSYSVGDLIPAPAGECWQVVSVRSEENGLTGLMCDPC